ncbi:MAG: Ig-like domain-containing protein, partial [Pirellulaceae bacterium]|nr:Ig-like domain-containing protein [Pirellulaceae bacterium]
LSTASGQSVTVGFATQDGTASGTTDFTTKSGTLTFSPGSTFATTSIEIKGDTAYEADETFTIKLSNGQTIKATESISIHNATTFVTLQNDDTPVANADSYNATEDTLLTVNATSGVLGNDPNHFTRTASLVTNGSKGTASLNSDGSFTYTPTANANGNDSFTYKYNDGRFDSNATTVAISITAVNDAPVAVDDVYDAQPGNVLSVPAAGILTNDTDVDTGDTKTVDSPSTIALSPVITGTSLTVNANGSFEYTPGSNTQGQTFAYVVRDTAGATSTATVTLRLGPAFSIVATSSVTETEAPVVINLAVTTTQATDTPIQVKYRTVNGDALGGEDYTAVTSGTITIPANGTTSTAPITILGDTRHESVETFRVELFGADVGTSVQNAASTTVVTITDNDTAPSVSISAVAPSAVEGDAGTTTLTFTVTQTAISGLKTTVNYTTADGTANAVSDYLTSSGALTIAAGAQTATISVTVNGDGSFEADETFKVKLTSATNAATSSPAEVTHTILNDDNPTAATDPYTAIEDVQLVKNAAAGVLANDDTATGPTITAVLVTPVASSAGVLALAPDGSFTFTTAKDSTTTATFTYKVRALFSTGARQFESTPTTVTITIDPRNDAPVAVDDQLTASPSNDTPANILANDIDVDNDTLLIVNASGISAADLVPQSATGSGTTLSVSSTGTLLYNPGTSNIPQAFVYTVTDGTLTATATVSFSQGPTFFVSVLNSPVDEDASTIDVEVKLVNAATTSQSTVKLSISQTTGFTATLGTDVGSIPGADSSGARTVTLGGSGGVATTTIQVPVINDTATPVREGPETVQFVLT